MDKKFEILNYDELPKKMKGSKVLVDWGSIKNGFIFRTQHHKYGYNEFEFIEHIKEKHCSLILKYKSLEVIIKRDDFVNGKIGGILIEFKPFIGEKYGFVITNNIKQDRKGIIWTELLENTILNTEHNEYGNNSFLFKSYNPSKSCLILIYNGVESSITTGNFIKGKIGNIILEHKEYCNKEFRILSFLPQSKLSIMWNIIEYGTIIKTKHKKYGYNEFEFCGSDEKEGVLFLKFNEKKCVIKKSSFSKGHIGNMIGCITGEFKYKIGENIKNNNRNLTIIDRKYKSDINNRTRKVYKYKCNKCGFDCGEYYRKGVYSEELWVDEYSLKKGTGCACCKGLAVVPEINSIKVKAPWMTDLGVSEEDAKRYSKCNGNKIKVTCPDCKKEKEVVISKIYNRRSISCICGDGFSRGHKFIYNILSQLNIKFLSNNTPKWGFFIVDDKNRKAEYDFIIEDLKLIIEVDGGFHRKDNDMSGQSKEESKFIDKEKDKLAIENGYEIVRVIYDDYLIKKSDILNSSLKHFIDLSNIDWGMATLFSTKNLIKEICDYWCIKKPYESTSDLGNLFGFSSATISKYLKIGNEYGWCDYNAGNERRICAVKMSETTSFPIEVFKNGYSVGVFKSASYLERISQEYFGIKINQASVSNKLNKNKKDYMTPYKKIYTFRKITKSEYEEYLNSQKLPIML